ncbi:GyrI-like domain-containing protein [Hyphomonas sp.]|uniref:AraC family transcriptional regulator n=1 Tax=Hyphomonas sp. TaxID=87 RepID=UPI0039196D49
MTLAPANAPDALAPHIARIQRAAALMAARLDADETPSLDELASAAAMSKYHFARVYRLLSGETCGETLQRLKLARGAEALTRPGASVTSAAMQAGYASSQAFAKALKEAVALPASRLRADPDRLAAVISDLSVPAPGGEAAPLRLEIASFDPFEILALPTQGGYPALNEKYWRLFAAAGGGANVRAILGRPMCDLAAHDSAAYPFTCALQLAAPAASVADGMVTETIPGGLFILARHHGSVDTLMDTLDRMTAAALTLAGLDLADAPPLFHYLDDPEETPEEHLRTDVYLPISIIG